MESFLLANTILDPIIRDPEQISLLGSAGRGATADVGGVTGMLGGYGAGSAIAKLLKLKTGGNADAIAKILPMLGGLFVGEDAGYRLGDKMFRAKASKPSKGQWEDIKNTATKLWDYITSGEGLA